MKISYRSLKVANEMVKYGSLWAAVDVACISNINNSMIWLILTVVLSVFGWIPIVIYGFMIHENTAFNLPLRKIKKKQKCVFRRPDVFVKRHLIFFPIWVCVEGDYNSIEEFFEAKLDAETTEDYKEFTW